MSNNILLKANSIVLFSAIFFIFSCKQKTKVDLNLTIRAYNLFADEFKETYRISALRNQYYQNPLEFRVEKGDNTSFAVIQTIPEEKILKNFKENKLTAKFVNTFNKIECRSLYKNTNFVLIELLIQDSSFFLYQGEIDKRFFFTKNSKALSNGWRYYAKKFEEEK